MFESEEENNITAAVFLVADEMMAQDGSTLLLVELDMLEQDNQDKQNDQSFAITIFV